MESCYENMTGNLWSFRWKLTWVINYSEVESYSCVSQVWCGLVIGCEIILTVKNLFTTNVKHYVTLLYYRVCTIWRDPPSSICYIWEWPAVTWIDIDKSVWHRYQTRLFISFVSHSQSIFWLVEYLKIFVSNILYSYYS